MAVFQYNPQFKPFAQRLRRDMTKEEKHLWYDFLRKVPVQVRRQKQFGDYIVDFYCSSARLVIELDGFQHGQGRAPERDRARDAYLESLGLQIIRIDNQEIIRNFDCVCIMLWDLLGCGDVDDLIRPAAQKSAGSDKSFE